MGPFKAMLLGRHSHSATSGSNPIKRKYSIASNERGIEPVCVHIRRNFGLWPLILGHIWVFLRVCIIFGKKLSSLKNGLLCFKWPNI